MYLSEETPLTIEDADGSRPLLLDSKSGSVTWRTIGVSVIPRLAVVISAGSKVAFNETRIHDGDMAYIAFGLTRIDADANGLRIAVKFRSTVSGVSVEEQEIISIDTSTFDPRSPWVESTFKLDNLKDASGSLVIECTATSPGSAGAELALYEFVVSNESTLDLDRARAFRDLRMRTEKLNFDAYYQHSIFQEKQQLEASENELAVDPAGNAGNPAQKSGEAPPRRFITGLKRLFAKRSPAISDAPAETPPPAPAEAPVPVENAFSYSHSLLVKRLNLTPPPFGWRLQSKVKERAAQGNPEKFRVLSLCSGAARIEADLVRGLPADGLKLTLTDLNPDLLSLAEKRLSDICEVEVIVGDVNNLSLPTNEFDVIMCVSGLHHVVELERLMASVSAALKPEGEFWSIGETIGRNGGRLWPESYATANAFFSRLDTKYRQNSVTGAIDEHVPDMDYSVGCFEGIRCEAIEPSILRHLAPLDVSRHNCIVWKLFSPSYSNNYDLRLEKDRALVEEAVEIDVSLFRSGGRPIELNGVYKRL